MENQMDVVHLPFVHHNFIGARCEKDAIITAIKPLLS